MTIIPPVAPSSSAPSFESKREPFALIPFSVIQALSGNVSRSGILVYCALATHADQDGHCWPGRSRLAGICNLSERQISRATAELERKGLLRKSYRANGMVDYYLLPVTNQATPPDTVVTPPLTPASPRTDQGINQKDKREPIPEPAGIEPVAATPNGAPSEPATQPEPPKAPVIPIPSKTMLPDDWELPEGYRAWAEQHRPDLTERLDAIAANFADYHAGKGTRSASWIAEWRRWINRERAVKAPSQARTAPQPERRYPTPEQQNQPPDEAKLKAMEASEQRRIAMMLSCGIDPVTGLKIVPVAPQQAPATSPDHRRAETPAESESKFQQLREESRKRFEAEMIRRAMDGRVSK